MSDPDSRGRPSLPRSRIALRAVYVLLLLSGTVALAIVIEIPDRTDIAAWEKARLQTIAVAAVFALAVPLSVVDLWGRIRNRRANKP